MFSIELARTDGRHCRAAWTYGANVCAGARGKLAAGRLAPFQRLGYFTEREIEHVVEQEGSALEWRQPVEGQQQRKRQVLGQLRASVWSKGSGVEHWLRQPLTDVRLAACARRFQQIEAKPRRGSHEKRSRIRYLVTVGFVPADVRLLHRVLRVSHRPKHAVGKTD